jgi:hypothetical protein
MPGWAFRVEAKSYSNAGGTANFQTASFTHHIVPNDSLKTRLTTIVRRSFALCGWFMGVTS